MKNKTYSIVAIAIIFVLVMTIVAIPSQNTYAGTAGDQLEIRQIMTGGAKVVISGTNQNGKYTKLTTYAPGNPDQIPSYYGFVVKTNNWWWQGLVFIRVYDGSGKLINACRADVPRDNWWASWKVVSVGFHRNINEQCD